MEEKKKFLHSKTMKIIITLFLLLTIYSIYSVYSWYSRDDLIYDHGECSGDMCMIIEEHGKIAVAELDFVKDLVIKYGMEKVEISALGYQFIDDDAYIKRLLGGKYENIDCIIPVKWPDGEVVYIETITNGEEEYLQISMDEFIQSIAGAAEEDIDILYDNMNNDQTYVRKVMENYK